MPPFPKIYKTKVSSFAYLIKWRGMLNASARRWLREEVARSSVQLLHDATGATEVAFRSDKCRSRSDPFRILGAIGRSYKISPRNQHQMNLSRRYEMHAIV